MHYFEGGEGEPLVILCGWRATPAFYAFSVPELCRHYHVYVLETRGTGVSEQPDYGYRISRISKDLWDMLESVHIEKAHFIAHSMGCSVLWSYIDLFGQDRMDKMILIDEAPWLWCNPADSDEQIAEYGGHRGTPWGLYNAFSQSWDAGMTKFFEEGYFTIRYEQPSSDYNVACAKLHQAIQDRQQTSSEKQARLLVNHYTLDWRDVIRRITVPTLYISGECTFATTPECRKWIQNAIQDCQMEVFTKEEFGTHGMYSANPQKFIETVLRFLG